jgi:hypothetical protein
MNKIKKDLPYIAALLMFLLIGFRCSEKGKINDCSNSTHKYGVERGDSFSIVVGHKKYVFNSDTIISQTLINKP